MSGKSVSFTQADLHAIANNYDYANAPAPVVIGHPATDAPAFGWAKAFEVVDGKLMADITDLEPNFCEQVKDKRYSKISLSLFAPDASNNPKSGQFYVKHIGFLGAAAPAVSGLKPVAFAAQDEGQDEGIVTLEFSDESMREVGFVFRRLRDFFISKFGLDTANTVIPDYSIRWIDEAANDGDEPDPIPNNEPYGYVEPNPTTETLMSKEQDGATKARQDQLDVREAVIKAREGAHLNAENVAFAEGLVNEGRLLPALKDKVIATLNHIEGVTHDVSFADTDGKSGLSQALKDILKAIPKVVNFGETDMKEGAAPFNFSAPQGFSVDQAAMDLMNKATALQAANPNLSLTQALNLAGGA